MGIAHQPNMGTVVGFVLLVDRYADPGKRIPFESAKEMRDYAEKEKLEDKIFFTVIEGDGPNKHREESEGASPDTLVGDRFVILFCGCGESDWFKLELGKTVAPGEDHFQCDGCAALSEEDSGRRTWFGR